MPNADRLANYRDKRAVDRTPEPAGTVGAGSSAGGLFVVHKHAATRLHYDLRLEVHGLLASWAVPRGPTLDPDVRRPDLFADERVLAELAAEDREALTLCDLEGLPQEEYARRKGIGLAAAKSRIQRARKRLRARMTEVCQVALDEAGQVASFVPRPPAG